MLPITGRTVLELGAGIGDHTSFFLDRGCRVTATDAREENIAHLRTRFPAGAARVVDVEQDFPADLPAHDIVYAYGVLYHLSDPLSALTRMAARTKEMLLLETCVSFGAEEAVNGIVEDVNDPTQAANGLGCRPTRPLIFSSLKRLFPYVYVPRTQPWHDEFPTNWLERAPANTTKLYRCIFVASRTPQTSVMLADRLLSIQTKE